MFCSKCGCELKNENSMNCPNCGATVGKGQVLVNNLFLKKNIMIIAVAAVILLIIFAATKLIGKSDEERIVGTWELVEEVYNGPRTDKVGIQVIFREGGLIYDEEQFLRGHLDAGVIVSWDMLEDNNILIFTNDWREQCSVKYELNGNKLKLIDGNTYCVFKKQ